MSTRSHLDGPQYWRDRAEEISALACRVKEEHVRQSLFEIGRHYEAIAHGSCKDMALPSINRRSPKQTRDTR
jgi:hypothetical protein